MLKSGVIYILVSVFLILSVLIMMIFRFGFRKYPVSEWEGPKTREKSDWDKVFLCGTPMEFHLLNTGISVAQPGARPFINRESFPPDYDIDCEMEAPVNAFAVRHPGIGDILIDSGLNKSFSDSEYGDLSFIMRQYQKRNCYVYSVDNDSSIEAYLDRLGLEPRFAFLTHMHPDHTSGLNALPEDTVLVFGKKENTFYYKMINGQYMKHFSDIRTLDFKNGFPMPPFSSVLDVFGDSSIFAISSPGHTLGHISYLVNRKGSPLLIAGDLSINNEHLRTGIEISVDSGKAGRRQLHKSLRELAEFICLYPEVEILYSHSF